VGDAHANNVITIKGIIQSITSDEMIVEKTWQSKEGLGAETATKSENPSNSDSAENVSVSISESTVVQNEKGKTITYESLEIGVPMLIVGRYLEDKSILAHFMKIISRDELKKDIKDKK
jgi:hypothetical protein